MPNDCRFRGVLGGSALRGESETSAAGLLGDAVALFSCANRLSAMVVSKQQMRAWRQWTTREGEIKVQYTCDPCSATRHVLYYTCWLNNENGKKRGISAAQPFCS
jgi:hypothetical protein